MKTVLRRLLLGREEGDFRPRNQSRVDLLARIRRARDAHRLPYWISMLTTGFTNRVVHGGDPAFDIWEPGFCKTREPADGVVQIGPASALAIANGDCPCVTIYDEQEGIIEQLHAGYRCLIRKDPNEPNIIEVGVREFPRLRVGDTPDPARLKATIWGGIGSCCWVPEDDKVEIRQPELAGRHAEALESCLRKTTESSPLESGHVSVDLYKLASIFLVQCGVPVTNISVDPTCTCCAMEHGEPKYWSETRHRAGQQPVNGRNFSVAWLEQV